MNFTTPELKAFRADFAEAMKALEQKYNIEISIGNISYSDTRFTTKMEVNKVPSNGKSVEQRDFETWAPYFGFSTADYNCIVETTSGNPIEGHLIGFKPKTKYPYLVRTPKGVYKCHDVKKI